MKTGNRNIYKVLIIFALLFSFYGCSSDEDEPQESQLPTFKSFQGTFSPISGNGEYVDGVWHSEVTCSATILDNGGAPIIEYGFCWVKNEPMTLQETIMQNYWSSCIKIIMYELMPLIHWE